MSGTLSLTRTARRVRDDELVLAATPYELAAPEEALEVEWTLPYAAPSFMCPTPIEIGIADEAIEIRAELETEGGTVLATDTMVVVPRCPEGDLAAFCDQICNG